MKENTNINTEIRKVGKKRRKLESHKINEEKTKRKGIAIVIESLYKFCPWVS